MRLGCCSSSNCSCYYCCRWLLSLYFYCFCYTYLLLLRCLSFIVVATYGGGGGTFSYCVARYLLIYLYASSSFFLLNLCFLLPKVLSEIYARGITASLSLRLSPPFLFFFGDPSATHCAFILICVTGFRLWEEACRVKLSQKK